MSIRATVRFFVGDEPLTPLSALESLVMESGAPINIADFSRSEYPAPHPEIQSALIVPILHQRRHAGLICLHGKQAGQFDDTALEITQSLAVQAAVALNNALAYEEQTRRGVKLKTRARNPFAPYPGFAGPSTQPVPGAVAAGDCPGDPAGDTFPGGIDQRL